MIFHPTLRSFFCTVALGIALGFTATSAHAATVTVNVGKSGSLMFSPQTVSVAIGDTVKWVWKSDTHSVKEGVPGGSNPAFDSGILNTGATFEQVFSDPGTANYFCLPHGSCCGMIGTVMAVAGTPTPTPTPTGTPTATPTPSATPTPTPTAQSLNVSTRLDVQGGDSVLIGGFIITDDVPKKLLLRAIGPSLERAGNHQCPSRYHSRAARE